MGFYFTNILNIETKSLCMDWTNPNNQKRLNVIWKLHNNGFSNRLNFLILDFLENFKIEKKVENKKVFKKNTKIVDWRDKLYVG